ncbi:MAG TPA: zf-HC2 domain-containing protein [bacterium]|nr:zf-HC2 domain-containing protein [bacterium]HOL35218.1 zf-HC2 domain-containing protein [bacterium]HPP08704.1 zf-HC2 domain-containing protein [bacterium]
MNCEQIKKKLVDYVDGNVSEPELNQIQQHFAECQECRKEFETLTEIILSVKSMKIPEHDENFWMMKYPQVIEKAEQRHHRTVFIKRLRIGFGLVAILLILFGSRTFIGKNAPIRFPKVPEVAYYVPEDVLTESNLPLPIEELNKVIDLLGPEDHMMILSEYLR